ncbi:MAG TPA: aquaporin [Pyrinomonadaceae bacterium]
MKMEFVNPQVTSVSESRRSQIMSLYSSPLEQEESKPNGWSEGMTAALKAHWPEYLMESFELGIFMISACAFSVLVFHPASPVSHSINNGLLTRALMGVAMGSTAIAIIFSPLGKRSGAHFNPAVTLTYLRLGKVAPWDAAFYVAFQFVGGIAGVFVASLAMSNLIAHSSVNYSATLPGPSGPTRAFLAELIISFILMLVVLLVSNTKRLGRWTGLFAGALVATYITFESPISGMSMNPARSFGSAAVGNVWTALWIYFTAPPLGMLLAAEIYTRLKSVRAVACAKLNHYNNARCIFQCNFNQLLKGD